MLDVFNSALSAAMAVNGGLMDGLKLGSNVILSAALRAGASNLILQLAELSEGMITQIDLKSLLSSMIGAGLGRELFSSTKAISVAEERAEVAANSVMGGFIDSAIEGKGIDLKSLFTNLLQSEAEDMLTAGRKAMSQADNAKQASQPNLAKIPAPEDTGTRKQSKSSRYANSNTNSNANINSNNSANDNYLGSYASANTNAFANSLNQNLKTQDHYESDPQGWSSAGSAAIAQKTKATNHMLNQMQQAVAQSDQQFVSLEELFNLYSAQVGAYSEFSEENVNANNNLNHSNWENAGRENVSHPSGNFLSKNNQALFAAQQEQESFFMEELKNPLHYAAGIAECYDGINERVGSLEHYEFNREIALAGQERAAVQISQISIESEEDFNRVVRLESIESGYGDVAEKYALSLMKLNALRVFGNTVQALEIGVAAAKIYEAKPENRVEVGFEEVGGVLGGIGGTAVGAAIGSLETVASLGIGAPAGIAITVAGGVAGAAIGKAGGRKAYGYFEEGENFVEREYHEIQNYFYKK